MVRHAITATRHLVEEDERRRVAVRPALLRAIGRMPAHSAREMLSGQRWLEEDAGWPDAAIHALRFDDDPQFEFDNDRDREVFLQRLGRRSLDMTQTEALNNVLIETCRNDHQKSLVAADVLAELGRPDGAVQVIAKYRDAVPDTFEMHDLRQFLDMAELAFETEAAIALADTDARRKVSARLQQWRDAQ